MKLQELNNWRKELFNIIADLSISINNAKYLINEKGSETVESIKKIGFFKHHTYQLKFIIIVQLCKIFDNRKNQKINIHKLFNKLQTEQYDEELNKVLSKNEESNTGLKSKQEIIKTIEYLKQEINKKRETIEKITSLRDSVFAHSDPNNTTQDIYWKELEDLINLSNKCYNEIYGKLYDCETKFEITSPWDVKKVIENFARCKDLNKR
ncbi:MAG: hypothetical protein ACTJGD_02390 [Mesonia hippocampi]|uniref:AbiU2 domain-containing protein n=1 Tax=Mesonia hippocampi TaxID=1628250 RepID=UPI003F98FA73